MNNLPVTLCLCLTALTGCNNAGQGAVSGAGVGALSGLAIGSLSGDAGKGAAIGAVVGGVGGAIIGDQNKRKAEQAQAQAQTAPPPSPPPQVMVVQPTPSPSYATGVALGKLVGNWTVSGTVQDAQGMPIVVSGTAQSLVDKKYFVRLDLHVKDPRTDQMVDGTTVISQSGGRNLELTNAYSSSPVMTRFRGEMDESGNVFSFTQYDPPAQSQRIIIRTNSTRTWTADVWKGKQRTEALIFNWSRE